ncbi:MAG: tetratricopeptide repeat protein [Acidobacteria bacterium]|nr:tetratricopeptide repeat protein [Acidobacteriota bacterium]
MRQKYFLAALWALTLGALTYGQTIDALNLKAKEAFDKQDYAAANASIANVLKRQPANEAALTLRARMNVRQGKLAEALADAEKVLVKNQRNYEALNVRGVARRELKNDLPGSVADLARALEIKPDYYYAAYNLGLTQNRFGRAGDALVSFARAAQIDPNAADPLRQRASIFINYTMYKESVAELDKAILLDAKNPALLSMRAYANLRLYLAGDDASKARFVSDADAALALDPDNSGALSVRAVKRFEAKDIDGAVADADRAIAKNPKNYIAFMVRGYVKIGKKDYDAAFEEFDKASRLTPRDSWPRNQRETALGRATGPNAMAAKAEFVKNAKLAVADDIWDFETYDALSDTFRRVDPFGDANLAKTYWEQLIAENPNNLCAIRFLGEYKARSWQEMTGYWEDALRRYDGKNGTECAAQIAFRLGREYNGRKLFSDAERAFAKAKELKPDIEFLDNNIAANKAERAEREKPLPIVTRQTVSTRRDPASTGPIASPMRLRAALAAYDQAHKLIELDVRELQGAISKYNSAGYYSYLYTGTRLRIDRIAARARDRVNSLLKAEGDFLPQELKDHLESDLDIIGSALSPN